MLEKCYEPMWRWIQYLKNHCENDLVVREETGGWCLGDWCTLDKTVIPEAFVNSCYFVKILKIVEEIASLIGKDSSEYAALANRISEAICRTYRDTDGGFCKGLQGADVFAIWCGIADKEKARDIAEKYAALGHFDTGFLCTDLLLELLFENGFEHVALKLLESEDMGSYLYMKRNGATTVWERWDGIGSHNHPMFGAPARYLFTKILGINYDSTRETLLLTPRIPGDLKYSRGSIALPIGEVTVGFERVGNGIAFDIELPEGVSAEFEYLNSKRNLFGNETFLICF